MKSILILALISSAVLSAQGWAQTLTLPVASADNRPVLAQGTPVHMESEQLLSSKSARIGDRFQLRVAEDVQVHGMTVIPAGARGVGEVTMVDKRGMFGKSGKIATRVLYVTVHGQRISLAGRSDEAGSGGTAGVVAAALLIWPVAPFVTGRSANLPPGTRMTGWIENDIPLTMGPAFAPLAPAFGAPLPAAVTGVTPIVLDRPSGPPRRAAKTASGFCYDVGRDYYGAGTIDRPALTSASPACWQLLER